MKLPFDLRTYFECGIYVVGVMNSGSVFSCLLYFYDNYCVIIKLS